MSDFGDYLKDLREKRGFGVNQLGAKSGVSSSLISKIENGHRGRPKVETIQKLSSALKVPFEEMTKQADSLLEEESDIEELEAYKEETESEKSKKYLHSLIDDVENDKLKIAEIFMEELVNKRKKP